jgi:hypothetical protein
MGTLKVHESLFDGTAEVWCWPEYDVRPMRDSAVPSGDRFLPVLVRQSRRGGTGQGAGGARRGTGGGR